MTMCAAFVSVRSALTADGRFAFETRHPAARAWERWTPEHGADFADADGTPIRWEANLGVNVQYGSWDRSPITDASPEIITIAPTRSSDSR